MFGDSFRKWGIRNASVAGKLCFVVRAGGIGFAIGRRIAASSARLPARRIECLLMVMRACPSQPQALPSLHSRAWRRLALIRYLAFLLAVFALGHVAARGELVSGEITQDRTLSGSNTVQGTVIVRAGVTLTIAPGATMLMKTAAALEVRGRLLAEGTAGAPILFTREIAGQRWKRLTFIGATGNRLKYCTVEYADCAGTHLDYYDNDCNASTAPPARTYHEAVVLLGSQADFISCTFRNLPDSGSTAEGDALAVISDDPVNPGAAHPAL